MSYNNTRRQTFCILVMIMVISMRGGNNKIHTEALGPREGVGSNYNESHTKALVGGIEGVGSNCSESHTKTLGRREEVGSKYNENCTKTLGAREGVGSNYSESHPKALGAREEVETKYNESHTKALRAREGVGSNYNEMLIEEQFLQWVKFVGTLKKHSLFGVAQNVFDFKSTFVVDKRPGKGDFKSIQQAVNSVPNFNIFRVVIIINPGIYMEKVSIPWSKPYITFQGAGSNNTIIQWNDTADKIVGGRALGTFNTATVAIDAPYFIATNLTFKNFAPCPAIGEKNKQASAVRVSGDASAFVGCQFLGAQDTLYDHKGRHFFQDCYIEGSVDFIFGNGLSMYKNCHVHAIGVHYEESITAQKRASPLEDSGFSFLKCKVTGAGPFYLGRAWGTFSRVVYAYTYIDSIVIPKGWYNWGDPQREGTVYYGQYKCWGPGASSQGRVMWSRELSDEEAQPFLDLTFVDGSEWIGL